MLRIIGVIKTGKTVVGYRILDENSGACAYFTVRNALLHLELYGSSHARIENGHIELLDGSMNSLPVIDSKTMQVVENDVFIVIASIEDQGRVVGYKVTDGRGRISFFDIKTFIANAQVGYYNAKLVNRPSGVVISAIKGSFPVQSVVDPGNGRRKTFNAKERQQQFKSLAERVETDLKSIVELTNLKIKRYLEATGLHVEIKEKDIGKKERNAKQYQTEFRIREIKERQPLTIRTKIYVGGDQWSDIFFFITGEDGRNYEEILVLTYYLYTVESSVLEDKNADEIFRKLYTEVNTYTDNGNNIEGLCTAFALSFCSALKGSNFMTYKEETSSKETLKTRILREFDSIGGVITPEVAYFLDSSKRNVEDFVSDYSNRFGDQ